MLERILFKYQVIKTNMMILRKPYLFVAVVAVLSIWTLQTGYLYAGLPCQLFLDNKTSAITTLCTVSIYIALDFLVSPSDWGFTVTLTTDL